MSGTLKGLPHPSTSLWIIANDSAAPSCHAKAQRYSMRGHSSPIYSNHYIAPKPLA